MVKIEIYSKNYCPYCTKAKALFDRKGVKYTEYDIQNDAEKQAEMMNRAKGRRTVPQIFIDDIGYGGCDDIHALDATGKLDAILG